MRFEDVDGHLVTLRTADDLKIAIRTYQKGDVAYMKLVLERAAAARGGGLFGGLFSGRKKDARRIDNDD